MKTLLVDRFSDENGRKESAKVYLKIFMQMAASCNRCIRYVDWTYNAPARKDEIRIRHSDGSWRNCEAVASNLTQG